MPDRPESAASAFLSPLGPLIFPGSIAWPMDAIVAASSQRASLPHGAAMQRGGQGHAFRACKTLRASRIVINGRLRRGGQQAEGRSFTSAAHDSRLDGQMNEGPKSEGPRPAAPWRAAPNRPFQSLALAIASATGARAAAATLRVRGTACRCAVHDRNAIGPIAASGRAIMVTLTFPFRGFRPRCDSVTKRVNSVAAATLNALFLKITGVLGALSKTRQARHDVSKGGG